MQLAMKAFAKVKQGRAVHVKIVSATWASDSGRIKAYGERDDKPDDKGFAHCFVPHGHPHQRHIDQDYRPEIPATSANCLKSLAQSCIVNRLIFAVR